MTLTKASVFIRTVGSTDSSAAFSIPQTGYVAFDAANFYKLEQGDPLLFLRLMQTDHMVREHCM